MCTNHMRIDLGFLVTTKPRGKRIVISIVIVSGSPDQGFPEKLTPEIDIAYIENSKTYVREFDELWRKAYTIKCPDCDDRSLLSPALLNALIMIGEGTIKAQVALNSSVLDRLGQN